MMDTVGNKVAARQRLVPVHELARRHAEPAAGDTGMEAHAGKPGGCGHREGDDLGVRSRICRLPPVQ